LVGCRRALIAGVLGGRTQDLCGDFADGLGVAFVFGPVFEQVGHACEGECFGLGLHELAAGAGDGFDGALGSVELLGVDDGIELFERELVVVAQVEDGDGWVDEVFEEGVGEGRKRGIRGEGLGIGVGSETPSADFVGTSPGGPGEERARPLRLLRRHLPTGRGEGQVAPSAASAREASGRGVGLFGKCGVEVVLGELVCCFHAGIVACLFVGTSAVWGSARMLRTKREMRGEFAHKACDARGRGGTLRWQRALRTQSGLGSTRRSRGGRSGLEYFYAFCDLTDAVHDCVRVFELVRESPCSGLLKLFF